MVSGPAGSSKAVRLVECAAKRYDDDRFARTLVLVLTVHNHLDADALCLDDLQEGGGGVHSRLRRSDFQQTMVSKRPSLASASMRWNSGRFFDQPRPTSW